MIALCPFFRENCHGDECVMWKNEGCLLVSFLSGISEGITHLDKGQELNGAMLERQIVEPPRWLKTSTPEAIAEELVDFKKEFGEGVRSVSSISHYYWSNKGVETYLMSPDIQMKIQKAELLADVEIRKDPETQRRDRLAKEKEELPSIVSQVVDFAKDNGLKSLTLADVDNR